MSYLLDTHILLWWLKDDEKLRDGARKVISSKPVWISVAAIWEIVIKRRLGKLEIPGNIEEVLKKQGMNILDIKMSHVLLLESLEDIHADPFDRIQICQAKKEGMTLITQDRQIKKYPGIEILYN